MFNSFYKFLRKQLFLLKISVSSGARKFYAKYPERLILKEFDHRINKGPFQGMQYISVANGSALSPKIVGTYERELRTIIAEVLSAGYKNIVDIGCAEGYYAVGFAWKLKNDKQAHVFAFDTNENALKNLQLLAKLNRVEDKITLKGYCDYNELDSFHHKKTFVICDIEGAEEDLIDPIKAPAILQYDWLIEIHDGGNKSAKIKDKLFGRFKDTHTITIVPFTSRTPADFDLIKWTKDIQIKEQAINEGRIFGLEWMYLKKNG